MSQEVNLTEAIKMAIDCFQAKKLPEAEGICNDILKVQPKNPNALHILGLVFQAKGEYEKGIALLKQAIAEEPNIADFHNNIGFIYEKMDHIELAKTHFEKALLLKPEHTGACSNLGNILKRQGQEKEAIACYEKGLSINPDSAALHNNYANLLKQLTQTEQAIIHYKKAIELDSRYFRSYNNLAILYKELGQLKQAESMYLKAIEVKPDYAEALANLAGFYRDRNQFELSRSFNEKAIKADPTFSKPRAAIGLIEYDRQNYDEAVKAFQEAVKINPKDDMAFSFLARINEELCDWRERTAEKKQLMRVTEIALKENKKTCLTPFSSLSLPCSPEDQLRIARSHAEHLKQRTAALKRASQFTFPQKKRNKRLRIGYLSSDFRNHTTLQLMGGLFQYHDKEKFEVFVFSYGPPDNSPYQKKLIDTVEHFVDLQQASHGLAAKAIYDNVIDILFELKGYTKENRLEIAALQPAPIQISYLGYPGTLGCDFIDYLLTDKVITPESHAQWYHECLLLMPHSYQINDNEQPIAENYPSREECELPKDAFVFCSFNNTYKLEPEIFAVWMNIMKAVPHSVLWLIYASENQMANLRREAKAKGIEPERLVFAKRIEKPQHLGRHAHVDLFLDTHYVNAHTTASDALWTGVPLLTCPANAFASRVSASLLTAMGLEEMIMPNLKAYEEKAIALAKDPEQLKALKKRVEEHRKTHPLFNTEQFVKDLEQGLEKIWTLYEAGERLPIVTI